MPDTTMIRAARNARRTVRITFHRSDETLSVAVVHGDQVHRPLAGGLRDEALADRFAAHYASAVGLDVSRLDIP